MAEAASKPGFLNWNLTAFVALGVFAYSGWLNREGASPAPPGLVDETTPVDAALFTHENNELHCPDRSFRHPCVSELRSHLEDKDDESMREAALNCCEDILTTSNDFWVLKNMTHLLLDLDTNVHAFDMNRGSAFVKMGFEFGKKLVDHPECHLEFDTKSELQSRCVPLYGKIVLLKLKNAGMWEEAKMLYDKIRAIEWKGQVRQYAAGEAIMWDDLMHTPQMWARGLRSQSLWPRETWTEQGLDICHKMEENFAVIKEETMRALRNPQESGFNEAYRFLYEGGDWSRVLLYHGKEWTDECERLFPKTCALLKTWLPSKPGLPYTCDQNEQVMIIKMSPGTNVEWHSGPGNNILNLHIGIDGLKGAKLMVSNDTYTWDEGKVIAWDGSYDHQVHCIDCPETRTIMMIRYMHPDMKESNYKGVPRTQFEEVPAHLQ